MGVSIFVREGVFELSRIALQVHPMGYFRLLRSAVH